MIDLSKLKTAEQKATEAAQAAKDARIAELKQLLRDTDYIALPDYDKDKPDVLAQRQAWRNELRALED
jgi:hypothetical protein